MLHVARALFKLLNSFNLPTNVTQSLWIGVCVFLVYFLHQDYPEKAEEIHQSCTSLLMDFSNSLDADIRGFLQYYTKNFAIPSHVPVYGMELEQSRGAGDRLTGCLHGAVASAHLNTQLLERVEQLQAISGRHEQQLAQVRKVREKVKQLEEAKRVLEQLRGEVASVIVSDGLSPTET